MNNALLLTPVDQSLPTRAGRSPSVAVRRFGRWFVRPHDSAPTSSIRGRGTACQTRTLTRRVGRSGLASASRHRQRTQQAQHAGTCEDARHVGARASQLLRLGSWRRGSRRRRCGQGSGRARCRRSRRSRCGRWCWFSRRSRRDWRGKHRGLHYTKLSGDVLSARRTSVSCNSPDW